MKKFCNKITKQQWRLTVPNVNTSIFKKSPKEERRETTVKCGSYDLQEAQREYDRSRSVPNSVLIETDSSDSDNYQDACAMSEKRSSAHTDDDVDVYEDADNKVVLISKNMTQSNAEFEYDVPKISFSFFEKHEEYATVVPKGESTPAHKSEVKIVLASPESFDDYVDSDKNSEKDVSDTEVVVETKTFDLTLTKDLTEFPVIMKSGSDPNISFRMKKIHEQPDEEDDDGLYKVPRRHHRLSQSLNDFNIENIETITSAHSSIEHISCSQVIVQEPQEEDANPKSSQNSESMDYCKTRSKLPMKLRRVTLLRKPKAKAVDTWINIRSKLNNMMTEHSAQQKVGAYENKEKLSINIQEVYNNSRDKCKRVLKSTGKIFRRNQENIDPNSDTSSQIIKNHAFFANLKASDIEYKLNYSNNSDEPNKSEPSSPDSNKLKVLSRSTSDEKKEEFDFSTIKSAFRRSKLITSTEVS